VEVALFFACMERLVIVVTPAAGTDPGHSIDGGEGERRGVLDRLAMRVVGP